MRRRPRLVAALLALLSVQVLSGCGLPTTDDVRVAGDSGPVAGTGDEDERITVRAPDPVAGATPEAIVGGFLFAQGSPQNGYVVARRFLAPELRESWEDLRAGALVLDGPAALPEPVDLLPDTDELTVSVRATVVGEIGADGWSVQRGPVPRTLAYRLVRIGAEWRIAGLPEDAPGLTILDFPDRDRLFPVQVMFLSTTPGPVHLVSDLVRIADDGMNPLHLVEQVLDGPSSGLDSSARSAVPEGTSVLGVRETGTGELTVDLSEEILALPDSARRLLSAQLLWTLRLALPGFRSMTLLAGGQPYAVGGSTEPQSRTRWDDLDPDGSAIPVRALAIGGGSAFSLDADGSSRLEVSAEQVARYGRVRAAVRDARTGRIAVLAGAADDGPLALLVGSSAGSLAPVTTDDRVSSPSWGDGAFGVWALRWATGDVIASDIDGELRRVPIDDPRPPRLDQTSVLRVSRDGSRVAIIDREGALRVGRVEVTDGRPRIMALLELLPGVRLADVAWVNGVTLRALQRADSPEQQRPLRQVDVDGVFETRSALGVSGAESTGQRLTAFGSRLVVEVVLGQQPEFVLYERSSAGALSALAGRLTRPRFPD